jgi:hypothetical protein
MESFILARVAAHSLEIDGIPNFIYLKRLEPKEVKIYEVSFLALGKLKASKLWIEKPPQIVSSDGIIF